MIIERAKYHGVSPLHVVRRICSPCGRPSSRWPLGIKFLSSVVEALDCFISYFTNGGYGRINGRIHCANGIAELRLGAMDRHPTPAAAVPRSDRRTPLWEISTYTY